MLWQVWRLSDDNRWQWKEKGMLALCNDVFPCLSFLAQRTTRRLEVKHYPTMLWLDTLRPIPRMLSVQSTLGYVAQLTSSHVCLSVKAWLKDCENETSALDVHGMRWLELTRSCAYVEFYPPSWPCICFWIIRVSDCLSACFLCVHGIGLCFCNSVVEKSGSGMCFKFHEGYFFRWHPLLL